jgi:hypothetical protein
MKNAATWIRYAGFSTFERARQIWMCQQIASDCLGIDDIALATAQPLSPSIRSPRRAYVAHVCASARQSKGQPAAQIVAALDRPGGHRHQLRGPAEQSFSSWLTSRHSSCRARRPARPVQLR